MLLRQIKFFTTVVDTGSFTEAAEECFISQSAISQQILSLEKELGVQLLTRSTRQFTLTEAGKYLYSHGKTLLGEIEKLKTGTVKAAAAKGEHLCLSYLNGSGTGALYQTIGQFKKQHPGVQLKVEAGGYDEVASLLKRDKTDLVFGPQHGLDIEGYEKMFLGELPCYAELSVVYPQSAAPGLELGELNELPCIVVALPKQQEAECEFYRRILGVTGSFLFAQSAEEARLMAAAGSGYWLTENECAASGSVKAVPLFKNGKRLAKKYYLFWKTENTNAQIQNFAGLLAANFNANG